MKSLSSQGLIDAYFSSIDLQLEKEFIQLLLLELKQRNIHVDCLSNITFGANSPLDGANE
ncbi:hypothetical protein GCM10008018_70560 [Paenibacillus marchantiophytorum]|uniref:Sporulation histidine kinase inhibitor Sda n=1 Tax=Paenibacillus marchantiophytorum TaxID=1619310 RepID=A0ABQ1FI29_9BACL|nr:sporulation histidine kinase inhibitor Sda [Paenibacillus marchantiophytorum]GGA15741.1 hypothetical protein GCM10008018_70560 [Paenibacillus marchantiophytorum]